MSWFPPLWSRDPGYAPDLVLDVRYGGADGGPSRTQENVVKVVRRAATMLPGEVGEQLLQLIEPKSLLICSAVVTVWAVAQFFGVGEVADVVLLVVGYAALGGVAISAARELVEFAVGTYRAKTDADIDDAARHLTRAVSLLTVQTVLAILLRKPSATFKDQYLADPGDPDPIPYSAFRNLPSNRPWGYKPSIRGDATLPEGVGGTSPVTGDFRYSTAGSAESQALARLHERVHQVLTPKVNILRRLRGFIRAQGYNRSYILRYLEEALAETVAQVGVKGWQVKNVVEGLRFPVERGYLAVGDRSQEARGLLLGPITVGGMTFNVWYSQQ